MSKQSSSNISHPMLGRIIPAKGQLMLVSEIFHVAIANISSPRSGMSGISLSCLQPVYSQPTASLQPACSQSTASLQPVYSQSTTSLQPVCSQSTASLQPVYSQSTANCRCTSVGNADSHDILSKIEQRNSSLSRHAMVPVDTKRVSIIFLQQPS